MSDQNKHEPMVTPYVSQAHFDRAFPNSPMDIVPQWRLVPIKRLITLARLIDPPPMMVDGKMMVFKNPHAAEVLTRISAEIRALIYAPPTDLPRGADVDPAVVAYTTPDVLRLLKDGAGFVSTQLTRHKHDPIRGTQVALYTAPPDRLHTFLQGWNAAWLNANNTKGD